MITHITSLIYKNATNHSDIIIHFAGLTTWIDEWIRNLKNYSTYRLNGESLLYILLGAITLYVMAQVVGYYRHAAIQKQIDQEKEKRKVILDQMMEEGVTTVKQFNRLIEAVKATASKKPTNNQQKSQKKSGESLRDTFVDGTLEVIDQTAGAYQKWYAGKKQADLERLYAQETYEELEAELNRQADPNYETPIQQASREAEANERARQAKRKKEKQESRSTRSFRNAGSTASSAQNTYGFMNEGTLDETLDDIGSILNDGFMRQNKKKARTNKNEKTAKRTSQANPLHSFFGKSKVSTKESKEAVVRESVVHALKNTRFYPAEKIDQVFEHTNKTQREILMQPGCYIIINRNNRKVYVGQSVTMFKRCRDHLKGRGNGDIYVDVVHGHSFDYGLVPMSAIIKDVSLNDLERGLIEHFDAVKYGYNKIAGNN